MVKNNEKDLQYLYLKKKYSTIYNFLGCTISSTSKYILTFSDKTFYDQH